MFIGNLKNFEVKLEAINERIFILQKRKYLEYYKQDLEYITVMFKRLIWKGFGSQCSALL